MDTVIEEKNLYVQSIAVPMRENNHTIDSALLSDNCSTAMVNKSSTCSSRRMTNDELTIQEDMLVSRRPSAIITALRRPSTAISTQRRLIIELLQGTVGSKQSLNVAETPCQGRDGPAAVEAKLKNRRIANDAMSKTLSALYAKFIVVLGISLPITDILAAPKPTSFYQGFYLYLYVCSVAFVIYMYVEYLRDSRSVQTRQYRAKSDVENSRHMFLIQKTQVPRYGSFYLRVGAIAFGIGSMVYSGLEFGQYFELKQDAACHNLLIALTPAARMALSIVQMQFIFLNTKQFEMGKHKSIARFGLMHMVATNLCEWLYVLVEETKHEIIHLEHKFMNARTNAPNELLNLKMNITAGHTMSRRATGSKIVVECRRSNIMGLLVQNASPFLFPCTIEFSLICAVILFEMWKKVKFETTVKSRPSQHLLKALHQCKNGYQLSVDCSRAHRGMFGGILVIVLTIIALIMFFVLSSDPAYFSMAVLEVTIIEQIMYLLTSAAVLGAMVAMRDLRYSKKYKATGIGLDCNLLLVAQSGIYIYSMFSMICLYFTVKHGNDNDDILYSKQGLVAEFSSLLQTSMQTMFILNTWWRRCKGTEQNRLKPGREMITFLLVANMAMWFINTLIKSRAGFRPTHLQFYGAWAWTIITHVSMPLAIFYRFHSTICLFEIWKTAYKIKREN